MCVDAHPFLAVGESFWDFRQVSDEEVRELLASPTTGLATARVRIEETPAEVVDRVAVDAPAGMPPVEALEEIVGDARIVLIGESSHGTHEFYEARAEITKWLIEQKGFCAVAAEADWPDAYRVNRYVHGLGDDKSATEALRGFERFPAWMWRNVVVRDFVDWLHDHNERRRQRRRKANGLLRFGPVQPASVDAGGHRISREHRSGSVRRGRGSAMRASTTPLPTTVRHTASPRPSAPACPVSGKRLTSWSRCSAKPWSTRAATGWSPRTSSSTHSRMRRQFVTPRSTTVRCSAAG